MQALVESENIHVDPILGEIGDPTALINVAVSIGRYDRSEIDAHFSAQPR